MRDRERSVTDTRSTCLQKLSLSLSLLAPCHPCFIRVSLRRHEHLNPFLFKESALLFLIICPWSPQSTVSVCVYDELHMYFYTNMLFWIELLDLTTGCLRDFAIVLFTEAVWMLPVWMSKLSQSVSTVNMTEENPNLYYNWYDVI